MLERLRQLYRHRVLIDVLVRRELKARYRGTVLGVLWSFLTPVVLMVIYTVVFSVYMRIEMEKYPVFLMSGLLAWNSFVAGLSEGTTSIISSGGIIKRVYLPSEVFPLVYVLSNTVHFLLSIPLLLLLMGYFGVALSPALLYLPLLVILQTLFTYGVVLITSSLAVKFRDLLHIIPNVVMVLFFLTPVFYPISQVPERFRFLIEYNPLAYFVNAAHAIFFYSQTPGLLDSLRLLGISLLLFGLGLMVFERRREYFAESI